ncbi:MAG TPA: hypothetical protein VES39_09330, partial [Rhodospirillales bacterium]|nr:hypothetical protein [Rhodospirillales bacterium]
MKRSFLFLQGPHGPFFRRLGDRLRALGHDVARVNLCGGDVVDWPTRQAVLFRDTSDAWAEWVADFARQRQVTDLVLYGDCRPLHRMAIDRLRPAGTRVHVFEEGYLRPNWITCEPDGVNGYSRFAMHMNPDSGPSSAPAGGFDAPLPLRPRPWVRAGYCLRHCAGNVVFAPMLPHYRTHRPLPLSREAIGWVKRGVRLRLNGRRMQQRLEHLCDGTQPVFLLLLQLDT